MREFGLVCNSDKIVLYFILYQGCHGQGKISGKRKKKIQVREMSGNFVDGQGNLERT